MEFTRLRVSGFKSFSEPIELDIDTGLTGIVGPNGCGKSNIVEAFRWVMGESSAKGLRGGEMDDVIFGGSAFRPAFDLAEVAIGLRRPTANGSSTNGSSANDHASADPEDVEISRRISRGVGSLFRINGRDARARDIQLLFADAGSGSRSPSIISQGRVAFIVDSKPEDRRRLLEDAAGIGGLHGRRREAELKLRAAETNLTRVGDQLELEEKRLGELSKQSRQADRYAKLQSEIRSLEVLLLLARYRAIREEHRVAEAISIEAGAAMEQAALATAQARRDHQEVAAALPTEREKVVKLGEQAARLAERHTAVLDAKRRREQELELTRQRLSEIQTALEELDATDAAGATRRQDLERDLARLDGEEKEARAAIDGGATEEAALISSLEKHDRELADMCRLVAEVEARLSASKAVADEHEKRRLAVLAELARLSEVDEGALITVADRKLEEAKAEFEKVGCGLANLRERLDKVRIQRDAVVSTRDQTKDQLGALTNDQHRCESDLSSKKADRRSFEERQRLLQRSLERLLERRAVLSAEAAKLSSADLATRRSSMQGELQKADDQRAGAITARDTAEQDFASLRAKREAKTEQHIGVQGEIQQAIAEREALAGLGENLADNPVLDQLTVAPGYEKAISAALGDELLLATDPGHPAYWTTEAGSVDGSTSLPEGVEALANWIEGPKFIAARLSLVGVVSAKVGLELIAKLKPGQRLVSKEGDFWRWDGLVRRAQSADPIEARLERHRRLNDLSGTLGRAERCQAAILKDLQSFDAEIERCALILTGKENDIAVIQRKVAGCREELAALDRALASSEVGAARIVLEQSALEVERGEIVSELDQLEAEVPNEDHSKLEGQLAGLRAAVRAEVDSLRQAEAELDPLISALTDLEREEAALGERHREAQQSRTTAELTCERRRSEAEIRRSHRTTTSEAFAIEVAGIERDIAALSNEQGGLESEHKVRANEVEAGEGARRSVALDLERVRLQISELRAAHAQIVERRSGVNQESTRVREQVAAALAERRNLDNAGKRSQHDLTSLQEMSKSAEDPEHLAARLEVTNAERAAAASALDQLECDLSAAEERRRLAEAKSAQCHEAVALAQAEFSRIAEILLELANVVNARTQQPAEHVIASQEVGKALEEAELGELEAKLDRLKSSRERIGPVNLRAAQEVSDLDAELTSMRQDEAELREAIDRLKRAVSTLNREARERLNHAFEQVEGHFVTLFQQLFGGGKAHLRLSNMDDPLAAGLELDAMPPGKKLQNMALLSGGEKSLTALALVFAFFLHQPSPLCILDEVDAALDDSNVERFVDLMAEIAKATGTRFLVVTHHPLTMAKMDRLFGVTMIEKGVSRLVSVALDQAVEMRATA